MKQKLNPPDYSRCQVEELEGSFMSFGPRQMKRCEEKPIVVVIEKKKDKEGLQGSMSMCERHLNKFIELDKRKVYIQKINSSGNGTGGSATGKRKSRQKNDKYINKQNK
jgi:hypothetical protein